MSRYDYIPPEWPAHCSLAVGWDDALESYFGLVIDTTVGQGDDAVIAAVGGMPPRFNDLDNLMRVVNARIRGRLPPVQLTRELRRVLTKDAARPVVNSISVTPPGAPAPAREPQPAARPCSTLGSCLAFLTAGELREVMDGMAGQFVRLETLYRTKQAAGLSEANDEKTKSIRVGLEQMEILCTILGSMVQTPDILVAIEALKPFYALSASAARILAGADRPAETVQ
jgi:hypothetical protein